MGMRRKIIYGVGIFFAIWAVFIGVMSFLEWRDNTKFERNMTKIDKMVEDREKELAKDTIGGNTPQETLEMFITAVEAGDYELASKYFVVEKQKEELRSLYESPKENINKVLVLLLGVLDRIKNEKLSDIDNDGIFIVSDPILVSFIKYPSGNWKINEI